MTDCILIGDPQCWGYEHLVANTALLHTLLLAYPESRVYFLAEPEHLQCVRDMLDVQAPEMGVRITWEPMMIPPRRAKTLRRLWREGSAVRTMLRLAARYHCSLVVMTAGSEIGFFILKLLLNLGKSSFRFVAALHGILATLVESPRKRLGALRGMRLVFRLPHPPQLSYLVFGPSILQSMRQFQPAAAQHAFALDLPYLWARYPSPSHLPIKPEPVVFGFLGVTGGRGKRFDRFAALAGDIRRLRPESRFTLAGHLNTTEDVERFGALFPEAASQPLTDAEFRVRAQALSYAVALADPEIYRLTASASFLDSLSYVKPGIYLRNMYIEEYFTRMGDIGYLCDSEDEVRECILGIIDHFPVERYARQCDTILRMRRLFEPGSLAAPLRAALDSIPASVS